MLLHRVANWWPVVDVIYLGRQSTIIIPMAQTWLYGLIYQSYDLRVVVLNLRLRQCIPGLDD